MDKTDFTLFLNENIKQKGINWKYAADKLSVPYITLIQWKDGKFNPPVYVQDMVKKEVSSW